MLLAVGTLPAVALAPDSCFPASSDTREERLPTCLGHAQAAAAALDEAAFLAAGAGLRILLAGSAAAWPGAASLLALYAERADQLGEADTADASLKLASERSGPADAPFVQRTGRLIEAERAYRSFRNALVALKGEGALRRDGAFKSAHAAAAEKIRRALGSPGGGRSPVPTGLAAAASKRGDALLDIMSAWTLSGAKGSARLSAKAKQDAPDTLLARLRLAREASVMLELDGAEEAALGPLEQVRDVAARAPQLSEARQLLQQQLSIHVGAGGQAEARAVVDALARRDLPFADRPVYAEWRREGAEALLLVESFPAGYDHLLRSAAAYARRDGAADPAWPALVARLDEDASDSAPAAVRAAFLGALTADPAILAPSSALWPEFRWRLGGALDRLGRGSEARVIRRELARAVLSEAPATAEAVDGRSPEETERALILDESGGPAALRSMRKAFERRLAAVAGGPGAAWPITLAYADRLLAAGLPREAAGTMDRISQALRSDPRRDHGTTASLLGWVADWFSHHGAPSAARRRQQIAFAERAAVPLAALDAALAAPSLPENLADVAVTAARAGLAVGRYDPGWIRRGHEVLERSILSVLGRVSAGRDVEAGRRAFPDLLFRYGRVLADLDVAAAARLFKAHDLARAAPVEGWSQILIETGRSAFQHLPCSDPRGCEPAATLGEEERRLGIDLAGSPAGTDRLRAAAVEADSAALAGRIQDARAGWLLVLRGVSDGTDAEAARLRAEAGSRVLRSYGTGPLVDEIAARETGRLLANAPVRGRDAATIIGERLASLLRVGGEETARDLATRLAAAAGGPEDASRLAVTVVSTRLLAEWSTLAAPFAPALDEAIGRALAPSEEREVEVADRSGLALALARLSGPAVPAQAVLRARPLLEDALPRLESRWGRNSALAGWTAMVLLAEARRNGWPHDAARLRETIERASFPSALAAGLDRASTPALLSNLDAVRRDWREDEKDVEAARGSLMEALASPAIVAAIRDKVDGLTAIGKAEQQILDGREDAALMTLRPHLSAAGGADILIDALTTYVAGPGCERSAIAIAAPRFLDARCARAGAEVVRAWLERELARDLGAEAALLPDEAATLTRVARYDDGLTLLRRLAAAPDGVGQDLFETSLFAVVLGSSDRAAAALRGALATRSEESGTGPGSAAARIARLRVAVDAFANGDGSPGETARDVLAAAGALGDGGNMAALVGTIRDNVAVPRLRAALGPGEALVAIRFVGTGALGWLLTPDRMVVRPLPAASAEMLRLTADLRDSLDPTRIAAGVPPPVDAGAAHALYRALLAPLEADLAGTDHLLLSPPPTLANLPFGALVTEAPGTARWSPGDGWRPAWLAERLAVTIVPSPDSVAPLRRARPRQTSGTTLIGGNPDMTGPADPGATAASLFAAGRARPEALRTLYPRLQGADEEIDDAAGRLAGRVTVLRGAAFAEAALGPVAGSGRLRAALLATHGEPEADGRPAFLLATPTGTGGRGGDGALTADEIATSGLGAEVVILSACRTGVSLDGAGGVGALVAGFFAAGSDAVVATHWPIVSDAARFSTADLVVHAGNRGAAGLSRALRSSMLRLIRDPPERHLAHPLYWAAFFVVGAPSHD